MDLKAYYKKIRQVMGAISDAEVVLESLETGDGGRAGVLTEAARHIAAKLVADGKARLATAEQAAAFRERQREAKRMADEAAQAGKVQLTVLPTEQLNQLKQAAQKK